MKKKQVEKFSKHKLYLVFMLSNLVIIKTELLAQNSTTAEVDTISLTTKTPVSPDKELVITKPIPKGTDVELVNYYRVNKHGYPTKLKKRDYRNYIIKPIVEKRQGAKITFKQHLQLQLVRNTLKQDSLKFNYILTNLIFGKDSIDKIKAIPNSVVRNKRIISLNKELRQNKYTYKGASELRTINVKAYIPKKGNKADNLIIITQPLDPASHYDFIILSKFDNKDIDEIFKIFDLLALSLPKSDNDAEVLFEKKFLNNPKSVYNIKFDEFSKRFKDTSKVSRKAYNRYISEYVFDKSNDSSRVDNFLKIFPRYEKADSIDTIFKELWRCKACPENNIYKVFYDSTQTVRDDYYLLTTSISDNTVLAPNAVIKEMQKNYKDLSEKDKSIREKHEIILEILKWKLATLEKYKTIIETLNNQFANRLAVKSIQNSIKGLNGLKTEFEEAEEVFKSIKSELNNDVNLKNASSANTNTNVFDFDTRGKNLINPSFGFVAIRAFRGTTETARFWTVPPYLGFHINLRPIDKDIPFRLMPNRNYRHYLSIFMGLTLSPLTETGKRQDLFNDKYSLLTGVGIRINNAIRLTTGTVWFKKLDPNPIINNKSAAILPYAGISIDLDLQNSFGGLSKLF